MLKNGTCASPATARLIRVLPVPGGPTSRTPLGMRAPIGVKLLGRLQELDNLEQLFFGFGRAGNILERDLLRRPTKRRARLRPKPMAGPLRRGAG